MKKFYTEPNMTFIELSLTADVLGDSSPEDNVGDIWGDGDDLFGDEFFDEFESATESKVPSFGDDFEEFED